MELLIKDSTFLQLCEEVEKKFGPNTVNQKEENYGYDSANLGGIKLGSFVAFKKGYANNKWFKAQPSSIQGRIEAMKSSQHPIQVTAIKPIRRSNYEGTITGYMLDVVEAVAAGVYQNIVTIPLSIVDQVDVKFFPADATQRLIKKSQKRTGKVESPEALKDKLAKIQTMANDKERKLGSKDVSGLKGGSKSDKKYSKGLEKK